MLVADRTVASWSIWAAIVILCREILVSGLREFLAELRVSVPVTKVAKWKTTAQLAAIGFLIAGPAGEGRHVDLGEGVFLPRAEVGGRTVSVPSCNDPTTVYLVSPSPHGVGASLDAPPNPDDRILYAYRGRTSGGRFGSTEVSVAHFARRALGVLRLPGGAEVEDLAVKMIVPAGCDASPEGIMAALRQDARQSR